MLFFTACVVYDKWKGKKNSKATARQAARADGRQQTLHCSMTDCTAEALGNSLAFPQQHNNRCLLWQALDKDQMTEIQPGSRQNNVRKEL